MSRLTPFPRPHRIPSTRGLKARPGFLTGFAAYGWKFAFGRKEEPLKKYNTIIFVPHARARFRKLTISSRFLALSAAAVAALFVASLAFGWAFFASSRTDRRYEQALEDNQRLRSTAAALHQRIDGISKQLSDFEARTRRLAIVAGLDGLGRGRRGWTRRPRWTATSARRAPGSPRASTQLEAQFSRRSELIAATPTVWPVHGAVNSGFGVRADPFTGEPAFHEGVDISTSRSEPVLATADGIVAAQRLGRRVRQGHRDRARRPLHGRSTATSTRRW